MIPVLIAEDELLIRMGLESSIPWSKLGFEVAASVSDGDKAWTAYQQYHPQVLITDILMPNLDGIELIKRIRAEDTRCRIVVITCVEYFDILYNSLNLDITGYLLKSTMTRDSLFRMVSRLKEELTESREGEPRSDGVSVRDALYFYLIDRSVSPQEFGTLTAASFAPDEACSLYVLYSPDINGMVSQSLINMIKDFFQPFGEVFILTDRDELFILMRAGEAPACEKSREVFDNIRVYMKEIFKTTFRVAFGRAEDLSRLPVLAEKAEGCLKNLYFYPESYISLNTETEAMKRIDEIGGNLICCLYAEGEPAQRYRDAVSRVRTAFGTDKNAFLAAMEDLRRITADALPLLRQKKLDRFDFASFTDAPALLDAWWDAVPHSTFNPIYSKGILDSVRTIHADYRQEITLTEMAKRLNISHNYYAVLFHQITGMTFSEFLISVRMYHACELLREGQLSISGIANECGFADASYFSRYFKQIFGITPKAYRKSRGMKHEV